MLSREILEYLQFRRKMNSPFSPFSEERIKYGESCGETQKDWESGMEDL